MLLIRSSSPLQEQEQYSLTSQRECQRHLCSDQTNNKQTNSTWVHKWRKTPRAVSTLRERTTTTVDRETDRQLDRQTETDRDTDRQLDRDTDRQLDRQTETDRQTDRQREREGGRERERMNE